MKTLFFSSLSILFPMLLIAQGDWCTCMKTKSEYDNITSYVSDSQNNLLIISSRSNSWTLEDKSPEKYTRATELPPPPPPPTPELTPEEVDVVEKDLIKDKDALAARADRRANAVKKRKRIFAKRLKKRKRARKYRGKCPRI